MARTPRYTGEAELATDEEMDLVLDEGEGEGGSSDENESEEKTTSPFKPMDEDEIEAIVGAAVNDAIDFIESEIAEQRIKAQRYFDGEVDIGDEEGRSTVVATKCRDTVRAVKPSIQRVFLMTERPVHFVPSGPEDVASMEQASTYASAKFRQHNGYQILRDVTHDALIKKTGITMAYWAEYDTPKIYDFTDLDDEQYQAIIASEGVEVIRESARPDAEAIAAMEQQIAAAQQMAQQAAAQGQMVDPSQLPQMPAQLPQLHTVRVMRRNPKGKLCIDTIPPEEFFVDRNARDDETFYVIGHRTDMRVADVIAMGVEEDDALELDTVADDMRDQEEEERRNYPINRDEDENEADPSMKKVTITQAYMRVDVDGTGVPILPALLRSSSLRSFSLSCCF